MILLRSSRVIGMQLFGGGGNTVLLSLCIMMLLMIFNFNVHGSWVDPDTVEYHRTIRSLHEDDVRPYQLVFSDEFEKDGRIFNDGNDPRWTALNKNDCKFFVFVS